MGGYQQKVVEGGWRGTVRPGSGAGRGAGSFRDGPAVLQAQWLQGDLFRNLVLRALCLLADALDKVLHVAFRVHCRSSLLPH